MGRLTTTISMNYIPIVYLHLPQACGVDLHVHQEYYLSILYSYRSVRQR